MTRPRGAVHVVTTRRHYKDKTYTAHLLRRSYREHGKVKNETVGNLSHLPPHVVELVRRALKGERFAATEELFEIVASAQHGNVQAVVTTMKRVGVDRLLDARPSCERRLVLGMIAARILEPQSKLATTRWWHVTTLPQELDIVDATEDDLYDALDWLLTRQDRIEKTLAARHFESGGIALYDLTSSSFEGATCPLARRGYSRDGKTGTLQINYGLLTDRRGCPVAVSVYAGNTSDSTTLLPAATKLREDFGLDSVVLVGERGMISQTQIEALRDVEHIDWITALKTGAIRTLLKGGALQMGLFDERNLFELTDPAFPGERLVACRNRELAKLRTHKRQSLIEATVRELEQVQGMVRRGRLVGKDQIGVRVGRVMNKYKVAKHVALEIEDGQLAFRIRQDRVDAEAALDGVYVIRTSLSEETLSADETVRSYKLLTLVERAFRSFKTMDLKVRPNRHRREDRVRAHIFLCMLAYYVQWHIQEAWRPVTFADEDQEATRTRDPVAPARRSDDALRKAHDRRLTDGTTGQSYQTLLTILSTIVRNTCRRQDATEGEGTFTLTTTPTDMQRRALKLLANIAL